VLVFTSHKAMISSQLHIESVTESYREVQEKNKKLQDALDRLQELSRLKSNFLATVSHELRTPLTSVIGYSEMLLEGIAGELNDEQKDYLKTILEKGESLLRLISSILDLSRIEARGVQLVRKPTQLDDLVQSALESVLPQSIKKKLKLHTQVSPGLPKVVIDADKLRQCLVNLLSNSVKFTPAGGNVTIGADRDGEDTVRLWVEDTGVGIPEEHLPRLFERFYKEDPARSGGGTGLGLAIVKRLVEAHQGSIHVEANEPVGPVFVVTLPAGRTSAIPPPRGTTPGPYPHLTVPPLERSCSSRWSPSPNVYRSSVRTARWAPEVTPTLCCGWAVSGSKTFRSCRRRSRRTSGRRALSPRGA